MPAPTLEGRLLCASCCAYAILGNGTLDPVAAAPYYEAAGFLHPPATFVGGHHNVDACLVGTTADGVVLVFRGTLSLPMASLLSVHETLTPSTSSLPSLVDWINNFAAEPVPAPPLPGKVHTGFLRTLNTLWPALLSEVKAQQILAGGSVPLLIAGHSKGGAVATLAAMGFLTVENMPAQVVTFAAPRAGNHVFAEAYNAVIPHTRYEYANDIVPHVPPSAGLLDMLSALPLVGAQFARTKRYDYASVGRLRFINWSGDVIGDSQRLVAERYLRLGILIVTFQFRHIGDSHRIICGTGYMNAICPEGVCP